MWTKSQKIAAAVLGLAVVAFGVDRFVLGTGKPATAEPTEQVVVSRSPALAGQAGKPPVSSAATTTATTLASRLAAFAERRKFEHAGMSDAFCPSDAWVASSVPAPAVEAKVEADIAPVALQAPKVSPSELFLKRHTLTAVMKKHDGGMAIIDGKLYAQGQTVDGFKLSSVGLNEATFVGKNAKVTLKLAAPPSVTDAR